MIPSRKFIPSRQFPSKALQGVLHAALALLVLVLFADNADAQRRRAPKPEPKAETKPQPAAGPSLIGQFGDWRAYVTQSGKHKVCYTLAAPKSMEPRRVKRDKVYFFISTRPAENVRNETNVFAGYTYKTGTDASVEIGPTTFAMYTRNDGAWIKNAADEPRLIEALRKSREMIVKGTSTRGTNTTDRYVLTGLPQALDKIAQECR